jgi:hypothetical protein
VRPPPNEVGLPQDMPFIARAQTSTPDADKRRSSLRHLIYFENDDVRGAHFTRGWAGISS